MTLYQLLLEERYGETVERGLLWYLNELGPEVVRRSPYEVSCSTPGSSPIGTKCAHSQQVAFLTAPTNRHAVCVPCGAGLV